MLLDTTYRRVASLTQPSQVFLTPVKTKACGLGSGKQAASTGLGGTRRKATPTALRKLLKNQGNASASHPGGLSGACTRVWRLACKPYNEQLLSRIIMSAA